MKRNIATVLIRSMIGRIASDSGNGVLMLGSISLLEREALEEALHALDGETPIPSIELPVAPLASHTPITIHTPTQVVELPSTDSGLIHTTNNKPCLKSMMPPEVIDASVLLCLDFGTAMSKAYATIIEDGIAIKQLRLRLGEREGATNGVIYPVPSALWISEDGKIYMGSKAITLSALNNGANGRQRFDSLKRELTQGLIDASLDDVRLDKSINPTLTVLSQADALILFLSYLTDLACTELENRYKKSRYVKRRFAVPSWDDDRRKWGEDTLRNLLARAQIVADTFHNQWTSGIDIIKAKEILDKTKNKNLPFHLIGDGIAEPLAAGASRLRKDEPTRGWAMVVDIGAGTSDFALFVVSEDPDRDIFKAWPIKGCSGALQMAGDTLDKALRSAIIEHAHVSSEDSDYRHIVASLNQRVRAWKEDLFRYDSFTYTLTSGARGTIYLSSFLAREDVKKFGDRLRETFIEILKRVKISFIKALNQRKLMLLFTGGGASLPMVKSLGGVKINLHGFDIECNVEQIIPDIYSHDAEMKIAYPQLAVAIGGAMPDIINEAKALEEMPDVSPRQFVLSRSQITGT